jgi:hypothetical protein
MKRANSQWPGSWRAGVALCGAAWLLCGPGFRAAADVVEMQNGDRYVGTVVSMGSEKLILQGDVLGRLELPRNQVALIGLGPNAATNLARLSAPAKPLAPQAAAGTNAGPDLSKMFRQLGLSTNLIQQVQRQFLSDAGPEAKEKFNELLSGLSTGKLNLNDIRAQAQSAAEQVRALKKELGEDAGWTLDAYLGILDHFLKENAPSGAATNAPAPASPIKPEAEASN